MTSRAKLEKIGINYKKGLAFFGYDEEMYQKYLLDFAKEVYTEKALEELNQDNVKSAFEYVHKLKSLVEYISIPSIDEIVHEITETLREGKTEGVLDGLLFIQTASEGMKQMILEDCE